MENESADGSYIVEDRMFNLQWASGLVSSMIPREWTNEEKAVVKKVFGKAHVIWHEELMKKINK